MDQANLTIQADNSQGQTKDATVPAGPGDGVANGSDSSGSPLRERDESHAPPPPPLHKKLLEIAEAGRTDEEAISAEFNALLLKNLSDIDRKDSDGKTALHVAIEHGLKAEARTLIQNKADIGLSDNEGQQPLYLACTKGSTELVTLLLNENAIVNAASNYGETPLAAACREDHTEVANILLDAKADTQTSNKGGWTPLHWASIGNHEQIVKHLLEVDASNINATAIFDLTALHLATLCGNKEVASLLLEKNADLSIKDHAGRTPLMTATRKQRIDILKMILHKKDKWKNDYLEISDELDLTPLHVASMEGFHEIASDLIDAGANCDSRWTGSGGDDDFEAEPGWTPLHFASFYNHSEVIALLLPETPIHDVEVDAKANDGRTSLHLASLQGNELIVKALLERGSSIDAVDETGLTPLHLASGANAKNRFFSNSDTVSAVTSSDDAPLWEKRKSEAKSVRHLQVVELLLQKRATTGIKAANGRTALHYAAAIGDEARIEVLLKSMKSEDLSWEYWKDSPVYSALHGIDPHTAIKSLISKQEIRKGSFWKEGGRIEVITEAAKNAKPYDTLNLLFGKLPRDSNSSTEGCENWSPFRWAAHERLPDVLSDLIEKSGYVENMDQMVHEALQKTSRSIDPKELQSKSSCELLTQVLWILITSSERTNENILSVRKARSTIQKNSTQQTKAMKENERLNNALEERRRMRNFKTDHKKNFSPTNDYERLREGPEAELLNPGHMATNFEIYIRKDMKARARTNAKSIDILATLRDILQDPPFAQISQTHKDKVNYTLPILEPDHQNAIKEAEATVVGFFKGEDESGRIRRNRSIRDIVYGPGPTEVMDTAIRNLIDINEMTRRRSIHFNSELYAKENFKLTWVHLPSTNMIWMNDLLTRIMAHERYPIREYYELRSFFRDSWVQVPDKESRSRMMRPRYVSRPVKDDGISEKSKTSDPTKDAARVKADTESETEIAEEKNIADTKEAQAAAIDPVEEKGTVDGDPHSDSSQVAERSHGVVASAVYMPYLEYSTHCQHWDTEGPNLKQAFQDYEKLLKSYEGNEKPQHGSPTLDEWYYRFSQKDIGAKDNQKIRNESQVVSKYLQENPKIKDASGIKDRNKWTVVRVNQLWIWTISTDWIITATSSPFTSSPDALIEEILNQLDKQAEYGGSRTQPKSTSELVPVIIDHCIGLYEKRPTDASRISIGQTFSHYINGIGRNETTLFDNFRTLSPREYRRKKATDKRDSHSQTMNSKQAHNDHIAAPAPATATSTLGQPKETAELSRSSDTGAAIQQAKDLYCDIKDVRDELSILRSVAQYQQIVQRGLAEKGVDESRFSSTYVIKDLKELDSIAERIQSAINTTLSLQQSDLANRQATEATEQGKTVMTFTFATVIFLPLSFLSSLFALDVASFQEAPAWAFYTIFFVSLGISGLLGSSAVYWENIMHFKDQFMASPTVAIKGLFKRSSTPSTILKSSDGKDTETRDVTEHRRIISKIKDGSQVLIKRFRGPKTKDDIDHTVV